MLLLAAAQETGLIGQLLAAVPESAGANRLGSSQGSSRQSLVLTLLFLGAVGLARPWELRRYSGDGLALLSGRRWAYGYGHTERFLSHLAQAGGDQTLSAAMAGWADQLWANDPEAIYYVDMHRQPVYSEDHLPRGQIGRTGKILACRGLALLNDGQGHPLLARTVRGDTHLTQALPDLVATYQVVVARPAIKHLVVDREGLGADFLASLKTDYQVVTLLKANQYQGLASFGAVGPFEPLAYDRQGNLITEVALAQFELTLAETPAETLPLYVALVRDQRRQVPTPATTQATEPTLAGLDGQAWWHPRWQATPLPAPPTEAKLIPIVSTHPIEDAAALVQTYKRRWPAQENVIRDFLIPLGLETNHGYAKQPVENSEFIKRQADLTQQGDNLRRWRRNALDRATRAEQLYRRRVQKANLQQQDLAQRLKQERLDLAAQGVPTAAINQSAKQHKAQLETDLAPLWQAAHLAYDNYRHDWDKAERYALKARLLLRQLEDLTAQAHQMYQLDDRKDHLMTSLRLALTNLIMWTRDRFFPPSYAHATWPRLAPFFRLPGHIIDQPDHQLVFLRPFNDQTLNRDLAALCDQVNALKPRLPDGRSLRFRPYQALSLISDMPP